MLSKKIIVASPLILDPVFAGKAIFIFENSPKGTQGIIINATEIGKVAFGEMQQLFNSSDFSAVKEMMKDGHLKHVPLLMGGPCMTQGILFIHGYEEYLDVLTAEDEPEFDLGIPTSFDTGEKAFDDKIGNPNMTIMEGLYFGTPYTFAQIVESGKYEEQKFRFYSGIAGWGPGQLEHEISKGAWVVMDDNIAAKSQLFFDTNALNKVIASANKNNKPKMPPKPSTHKKKPGKPKWIPKIAQEEGYNPLWN